MSETPKQAIVETLVESTVITVAALTVYLTASAASYISRMFGGDTGTMAFLLLTMVGLILADLMFNTGDTDE